MRDRAATESESTDAGGGRIVIVSPTGGAFSVAVSAAPLAAAACA